MRVGEPLGKKTSLYRSQKSDRLGQIHAVWIDLDLAQNSEWLRKIRVKTELILDRHQRAKKLSSQRVQKIPSGSEFLKHTYEK